MPDYFFDQAWAREKRRLDALSALYDSGTIQCLTRVGVTSGWRCLEVGAGTGTIARWMATQVGSDGKVIATDLDVRFLTSADDPRVEIRTHDLAQDPLEPAAFDVIHARAVLQHIPARAQVMKKLVRALRPGGWLVLEDIVAPTATCHPELPSWARILEAIARGLARAGADQSLGIKLHQALVDEGLVSVGSEARVPLLHTGTPSVEFVALSVEQAAERLVASGAVAARDVEDTLAAFQTPGRIMTAATMIASWGRTPPAA